MSRPLAAVVVASALVVTTGLTAPSVGSAPARDGGPAIEEHKRVRVVAQPTEVTPDDLLFQYHRLRSGTPAQAQLLATALAQMSTDLRSFLDPSPQWPMYAGGVVLASRHGVVPVHDAAGKALRYSDAETELPADQQVPVQRDTIFDLASVTKTFTTIAVMQQVEAGRIRLDEPVATYLPSFAANGKEDITIRHLLTHTGGLPAWLPLYSRYPTKEERLAAVLAVTPTAEPEQRYVYSDLGLITLGLVVDDVTGDSLDEVIADRITRPLAMTHTMFNPPARLVDRIAATEEQPWAGRPMIRGEVHDENAWSLGGVAGHAGLFSTAHDLAVLARTLLNGGRYGGVRILETETVRAMIVNENEEFPANSHGLGFELDQRWYMDGLSTPVTFGHTGFTGTSVVIDPLSDSFVILLTNRVHPTRDWGATTRHAGRSPATWRGPSRSDPSRASRHGSPGSGTPVRRRSPHPPPQAGCCRLGSGTTPRPDSTCCGSRHPPTAARHGRRCRSRCAAAPRCSRRKARSPVSAAAAGIGPPRHCRRVPGGTC